MSIDLGLMSVHIEVLSQVISGIAVREERMSAETTTNGTSQKMPPIPKGRVVILTPSAQEEVRRLLQDDDKAGMGLRLGIKGGGCSGLSYVLDFTEENEGDTVVNYDGFEVFLDRKSTIYLSGTILDHQGGLTGRGFVFQNPMASNTCGCGESFSL
mgnify:CR=1 FL=1